MIVCVRMWNTNESLSFFYPFLSFSHLCVCMRYTDKVLLTTDVNRCPSVLFTLYTLYFQKLQVFVLAFAITGSSVQYVILRFDKADHVTFDQSVSEGVLVVLHLFRFVSCLHVLYAYALFWYIACCVMLITGHSMVEFQGNKTLSITLAIPKLRKSTSVAVCCG